MIDQRWSICIDVGVAESALADLFESILAQTVPGGECLLIARSLGQQQRLQRAYSAFHTQVCVAPKAASWLQRLQLAVSHTNGTLVLCLGADWHLDQRTMEYVFIEAARTAKADFWSFTRQAWIEQPGRVLSLFGKGAVPAIDDGLRSTYLDLLLYGAFLRFCTTVWRRDCLEACLAQLSPKVIEPENSVEPGRYALRDFQVMLTAARLGYIGIGIPEIGPIQRVPPTANTQRQSAIWQQRLAALQSFDEDPQFGLREGSSERMESYRFSIARALQHEAEQFTQPSVVPEYRRSIRPTESALLSYIIVVGAKLWPLEDTLGSLMAEEDLPWEAVVVFPPQVRLERWLRTRDHKQRLRAISLHAQCSMGAAFNAGFMVARGSQCVFLQAGTKVGPGHARAVLTAPQRTLEGKVGCATARLVILERDLSTGWISEQAFVAPEELALDSAPGVPLDALSFHHAEFLQRGPFVTDSHHFPGWDLLLRKPSHIYPLPTSVDVSVRVGASPDDARGQHILETVDRQYAQFASIDAAILQQRKAYRQNLGGDV